MNRSSVNQNKQANQSKRADQAGRAVRVSAQSRQVARQHTRQLAQDAPSHLQKRWQPQQNKTNIHQQKQSVLRLSSAEQETILRQRALAEAQHGNHIEAIAIFSELIDRNPQNANHYSNRGLVYFQSGQPAAAIADYNRAIELNPRLDSAYNNRANYYAAQGKFLEAILDYDIALDLNPANVRAWINQGITFRELEMYDRALESFDLALCLGKLEGHIYAERGRTYHLRGDWNCAIGDYRRALEKLAQPSPNFDNSGLRLYLQVESWLDELLSPLHPN
ncbi:tetratricopeptide repeat protein [Leptolyngbya sp. NK1-12]|uniref:Tetratricopeptide repeat protein n=1 Tax=Leptolyngbya sp. NK1-12 TaxID=2547451 RepID=A0AA97AMW4_9CYAN|nr:tetratricopeptide repeat protein [Leptolyngbya sp. NK1-12]